MSAGLLYDATECIGCGACSEACKQENHLPQPIEPRTTAYTWTTVGERAGSHVRNLCMHCLEPTCVSVCPVGALSKTAAGPVVYDGILYATTHLGTYAIDATTCRKLWSHQHDAQGPEMNATNKGIAIAGGRVIRGSQDGFLYALDAKSGEPLWVRQVADWSIGEGIGAAPTVWNDLVYVAKAGGDWASRAYWWAV